MRTLGSRNAMAKSGDVVRAIELAVIGGDWGANGYTTIAQADQLADMLELAAGSLVLDIGGWARMARPLPRRKNGVLGGDD